jgi:hypothetical protein
MGLGPLMRLRIPPPVSSAWLSGLVAVGHDPATLADLEARGWVTSFEFHVGRGCTLTPAGAAWLGVEVRELGADDRDPWAVWVPFNPRPRPVRLRFRCGEMLRAPLDSGAAAQPAMADPLDSRA